MRILRSLSTMPGKAAVLQRGFVAHVQSRVTPVYLVNEYPKCGGTWLKFMLAEALDVPAWTVDRPVWGQSVLQAHWLAPRGRCRTVALHRDGRDVMVSYYFHSFFVNEFRNGPWVRYMRDRFGFADYEDTRANLPAFMKAMIETPISPGFSWIDFARAWTNRPGTVQTSYEALRRDTGGELARIVHTLTGAPPDPARTRTIAENHTMQRMRERKAALDPQGGSGQVAEKSFIRQGSIGGWSDHFTDEALAWFEDRAGPELQRLGYALGRPGKVEETETARAARNG